MGLAFDVAGAISDGVNQLCALLEWSKAGAVEAPPVDSATLTKTMVALEEAMREILHGGRVEGAERLATEEDLSRVTDLKGLILAWPSTGALPSELVTLAEACVSALLRGMTGRDLTAEDRRKGALR